MSEGEIYNCDVCGKKAKYDIIAHQYYCTDCGWWICV